MKQIGDLKKACIGLAVLCSACSSPEWDTAGGPNAERFPGQLRVVQARARIVDSAIELDLRNAGDETMCFWATAIPSADHAVGFRVFMDGGVEKPAGELIPAGSRVVELEPGQQMSTEVRVRPWFDSDLREGECVLFEATYFSCADTSGMNRGDSIPLASLGIVQSSWRVQDGRLNLIPQSEPSCREHSDLIRGTSQ